MDKAILVIDMPSCCDECFALDEYGDYPVCRITQEQRGYTFRTREQKMSKCPLQPAPEKYDMDNVVSGKEIKKWLKYTPSKGNIVSYERLSKFDF